MAAAVALANLDVFEREDILEQRAARTRASSAAMLESLRDIPIVGDVRGAGYFHAIELVKDRTRRRASTTRSPRRCCAASSPASSTAAA